VQTYSEVLSDLPASNAPLVKQQCPEVDFVCRGDGEQLILDLLQNLDDPSTVESVTWAKDGQVVSNPNRKTERHLDQWPFPDRESLKLDFVDIYKLLHYPVQTFRLLRRFLRFMPVRDVAYLIIKPFLGKKKGATKAEVLSRAVEHGAVKDAAAQMTRCLTRRSSTFYGSRRLSVSAFNGKPKPRRN
jgi:hypothetical protein